MAIAIYPGSFDPVTSGHIDVIHRASRLFDKLVVAVYDTPGKELMFSTDERVDLIREATSDINNVEVRPYCGLTVDFAHQIGAHTMVRGLRVSADFEHEFDMAMMNKRLAPDLEMVCLMASTEFQFLSSSVLKEVAHLGGNVNGLVPPNVADALKRKVEMGM
jgi:pantetheine-phosphate adenylyltransferase